MQEAHRKLQGELEKAVTKAELETELNQIRAIITQRDDTISRLKAELLAANAEADKVQKLQIAKYDLVQENEILKEKLGKREKKEKKEKREKNEASVWPLIFAS